MPTLDPHIVALAKAIRHRETKGEKDPYAARAKDGGMGAYQFQPATWKMLAKKYLKDENAPLSKENQNYVAYQRLSELRDKGLNPAQIAVVWNAGHGALEADKWKEMKGVNAKGVPYDVPSYVTEVYNKYQEFSGKKPPVVEVSAPQKKQPTDEELGKMSHADIYRLREASAGDMPMQKKLAVFEREAFAREIVKEKPWMAASLAVAVPAEQWVKGTGVHIGGQGNVEGLSTPADPDQMAAGFRGIATGLHDYFNSLMEADKPDDGNTPPPSGDGGSTSP